MKNNLNLGYACINLSIQNSVKNKITNNRGMIKRTFKQKGVKYASHLAKQNVADLLPILKWNKNNNVKVFRMTSCLFPWASEYNLKDLPDYVEICKHLTAAGEYARENGIRLSFHPGPFNILASPKQNVVENSFKDLTTHGEIFDLMGMPRNHWSKINIHVGAAYGDHQKASDRWCQNFEKLPDSVKSRLTVENDDKANLYSTNMLYDLIHLKTGVPIVFDFHHHKFCTGGQTTEEALALAVKTWGDVRPTCHYSESAAEKEGKKVNPNAHSDYIYDKINTYGQCIDVVIEAKAKELSLLKYRELYGNEFEENSDSTPTTQQVVTEGVE
jgi:UV DNA damage endonuclease